MTETAQQMAREIVAREGGYADQPADKGGPTMYGITETTAARYGIADVRDVTPEIAVSIMLTDYFITPGLDRVPAELQPQLFDISVNSGAKEAVMLLQHALVVLGASMPADGKLGALTVAATEKAVQSRGWQAVEDAIVAARVAFYRSLVACNPAEQRFLDGWEKRAESFEIADPNAAKT